jgi:hypothetical protein
MLTWLFFESPIALAIPLGLLWFGLLVYWRRGGSPRPLLAALAAGAALLLVQALVQTHREIAVSLLRPIEEDVLASRVDALAGSLATDFRAGDWDTEEFLGHARDWLARIRVSWLTRSALDVAESRGDVFIAEVAYAADVRLDDFPGVIQTRWRIHFARVDRRWRIRSIDPPQIQGRPAPSWSALRP